MPYQQEHAELMAQSLPWLHGPFANHGAIGQPVIRPPQVVQSRPYQESPSSDSDSSTLFDNDESVYEVLQRSRPRVAAASYPWNDAEDQARYNKVRAAVQHAVAEQPSLLDRPLRWRQRGSAVARWIDTTTSPPVVFCYSPMQMTPTQSSDNTNAGTTPPTSASSSSDGTLQQKQWALLASEDRKALKARWMNSSWKCHMNEIKHWNEEKEKPNLTEASRRKARDMASDLQGWFEERKAMGQMQEAQRPQRPQKRGRGKRR
ncbi:MAG: hypothetical protein Q9225_007422 [Loekoesia sp. 1 TL-2023]